MIKRNALTFLSIATFMILSLYHKTEEASQVEPFMPELFSQFPSVRDIAISAQKDEIYFTAQSPMEERTAIVVVKKNGQKWITADVANFSGKYRDIEPFLTPDGLKLYFSSNRPLDQESSKVKDFDIWYVQRTSRDSEWSKPMNMGEIVNSGHNEFYPSLSLNGNLYFTSDAPGSKGFDDIYISTFSALGYKKPVPLDSAINSSGYDFNGFIAPDESYLIFTGYGREDGLGSGDLYISYRMDGNWTQAVNMGPKVNSDKMDYCPFVSHDGKTLYFTSKKVDFSIPEKPSNSINELSGELSKYENGMSRIYKVILP